jgi:hypothetical protein
MCTFFWTSHASEHSIYWCQCVSFCTSNACELSIYFLPCQCAALLRVLPHICGEFENVALHLVGHLHQLHPRVIQLLVFHLHCQVVLLLLTQYLYFCTRKTSKLSTTGLSLASRGLWSSQHRTFCVRICTVVPVNQVNGGGVVVRLARSSSGVSIGTFVLVNRVN